MAQRVVNGSSGGTHKFDSASPSPKERALFSILALLCLLCPSLAGVASAGINRWTTNGPTGGDILALAIDPSSPATIYAGLGDLRGIRKSTNGGETWSPNPDSLSDTNYSFLGVSVFALAIDPSSTSTIYAGTIYNGVFKSTDGGASWSAINTGIAGLPYLIVLALAIDPRTPATIYAGVSGSGGGGVFKSTNGGGSWSPVNAGLTHLEVRTLAIDPLTPATVYAGTFGGGVFKSTNGGESWGTVNAGLPATVFQSHTGIETLVIDPSTPTTLYAGTSNGGGGAFKSTDGGGSWRPINVGLTATFHSLVIDPSAPAILYAGGGGGVFKSTDSGGSWSPINTGLTIPLVQALVIDPSAPATLYAGTFSGGGVFKSTDRGGSWSPANGGMATGFVNALAIDPLAPATLYAGAAGYGVFKSTNGGVSWTFPSARLTYLQVVALAVDPSAPGTLYAGTDSYDYPLGVFKSTDGGARWSESLDRNAAALAIDPLNPSTVYASVYDYEVRSWDIFKSGDRGASWGPLMTGLTDTFISSVAIDPSTPATIYAGTSGYSEESGGILKSTNGGMSWTARNAGLTNTDVTSLAIDPTTPATIYAGTPGGVFKSTNAGESWTAVNAGLTNLNVWALAVDPSKPATLYAGTGGAGAFKSTDGGASWTAMNAGLTDLFVKALAIDPSTPARIYAGTGGGVFEYLQAAEPCVSSATALCLNEGRFRVTTEWLTRGGQSGLGQAVALTSDTGYFTFFDAANVEMLIKVLDGCRSNARFWTFAGGLTDVRVDLTVFDSLTGDVRTYTNPQGKAFQPIQDTSAFATCSVAAAAETIPASSTAFPDLQTVVSGSTEASEVCVADSTTLCLNNARYKVQSQWITRDGASGSGLVIPMTGDTGAFWFFGSSNVELVVKVLNGCGFNSRYWTFAGGLTDVNVVLTVTDTMTGAVKTYVNPQGAPFQPIQDTTAFATCP